MSSSLQLSFVLGLQKKKHLEDQNGTMIPKDSWWVLFFWSTFHETTHSKPTVLETCFHNPLLQGPRLFKFHTLLLKMFYSSMSNWTSLQKPPYLNPVKQFKNKGDQWAGTETLLQDWKLSTKSKYSLCIFSKQCLSTSSYILVLPYRCFAASSSL